MPEDSLVIGWNYNHYGDTPSVYDVVTVESDVREFGEYVLRLIREKKEAE